MIKIIQITPSYKPASIYGGTTASVSQLCEALHQSGTELSVLTTTANGKEELAVKTDGITLIDQVGVSYCKRITKDHTHFSPALLWNLIKLLKQKSTSKRVIHIHSWWNLVAICSCFIAKWFRVPVVLSPRGMLTYYTFNNRNSFYKACIHQLLGKRLLKTCYIHVTSKKEAQDIRKLSIQSKNTYIIPNLVHFPNQDNILPLTTEPSSKIFNLLFLSRIEEKKGLDLLLTALSCVSFKWKLSIAGTGNPSYVQSLKRLSHCLNLPPAQINWKGQVNDRDKFKLIRQNDLLVLPSHNENFANVVIESLSVGTPVILSKEIGLANYVTNNHLGWTTDLHSLRMARTLNNAVADQQMRTSIRKLAPEMISRDFCPEKLTEAYHNMYQYVLIHAS